MKVIVRERRIQTRTRAIVLRGMTDAIAREMLAEHRAVRPQIRCGRSLYILNRAETGVEVYRLSKDHKRALYLQTIRLDEPTARYLMPTEVIAWVQSRTGLELPR